MNCPKCGANIEDGSKFCVACGNPLEELVAPVVEETPAVEAIPVAPVPPTPPVAPVYYQPQPQKKEFTENDLPEQYKPLGAWSYFGLQLLFSIPIVGFVFLIVFSFSRGNLNRRSFARSYWCAAIVAAAVVGLLLIFIGLLGFSSADLIDEFMYY